MKKLLIHKQRSCCYENYHDLKIIEATENTFLGQTMWRDWTDAIHLNCKGRTYIIDWVKGEKCFTLKFRENEEMQTMKSNGFNRIAFYDGGFCFERNKLLARRGINFFEVEFNEEVYSITLA